MRAGFRRRSRSTQNFEGVAVSVTASINQNKINLGRHILTPLLPKLPSREKGRLPSRQRLPQPARVSPIMPPRAMTIGKTIGSTHYRRSVKLRAAQPHRHHSEDVVESGDGVLKAACKANYLAAAHVGMRGDTQCPHDLIRSIRDLQQTARKVFYHSQRAYDPSPLEAQEFCS